MAEGPGRPHIELMAHRPMVLLADDDSGMRRLLELIFDLDGGFRMVVAADGLEAAMLAEELQPDLAVLDYFMPRWDGQRAAEYIRSHCPRTKIVAFSAVLAGAPSWADAFLLKTDVSDLTSLVHNMLDAASESVSY